MITITSFIHREELKNIIQRWMYGEAIPSDAVRIAQIVNFNIVYINRYLNQFAAQLFSILYDNEFYYRKVVKKADLKDLIISHPHYRNPRVDELIYNYLKHPGRFYRETPFRGVLFLTRENGLEKYIGSCRIKRVRRLAEKGARRLIDHVFATIKNHADQLAQERANRLGIRREQLFTSPESMMEEFVKAESRLLSDLENKRPILGTQELVIQDVAGIKVVCEDPTNARIVGILEQITGCRIFEREMHSGQYNATNIIVQYTPDLEKLIAQPLNPNIIELMGSQGISSDQANQNFKTFVLSGEKDVNIEIIVTNYMDMLESEIGKSMHEDRIIQQRLTQQYQGQLARNIEFLLEYLFSIPLSMNVSTEELPIKLWNLYLPDYFEEVKREIFQIPAIGHF